MQTFDAALFKLYKEGRISMEEAIRNADSQNDVRLRIKLDQSDGKITLEDAPEGAKGTSRTSSGLTLSLVEEEKKEEDEKKKPGSPPGKPPGR
jgi:twitching motility protein PilU